MHRVALLNAFRIRCHLRSEKISSATCIVKAGRPRLEARDCVTQAKTADTMDVKGGEDRYEGMKVNKSNRVFSIQLNRPQKKNAFTTQMYYDLASALREAAEDEEVYVATLTGTGDYYSSGNDLGNFLTAGKPEDFKKEAHAGSRPVFDLVKAFINFPKPLIALVNGPAVGIAVTLLGLCDAVYCSDTATFLTPFTQLAQNAEGCSSYVFPIIMGGVKAKEMLLFNKKINAQEAYERNLVTRIIPDADFRKETEALVSYVASLPPQSMQSSKKLIRGRELELLHRVNEAEMALIVERVQSPEVFEAVASFFSRKNSKL